MRPAAPGATVAFAPGVSSQLRFDIPTDTRITDFSLNLRHWFSTPSNVGFNLFTYGNKGVSLAGSWDSTPPGDQAAMNQEKHWYGGGGAVDSGIVNITKSGSPQAQRQGTATTMSLWAGCTGAANCTLDQNSIDQIWLTGSRVTIDDLRPPVISDVHPGTGLLAPGLRAGDEPVTFSASDNTGIRRAEILDVTDAANPVVVATEDYSTGPNTDDGHRCDFTRTLPCPNLSDETIAASPPIGGHRTLLIRVTDSGGDTAVSAPFNVVARGPLNGVNGGDGARLVAGFPAKVYRGKARKRHAVFVLRPRHTVSYGNGARIRGTLRNAAGQPIGSADVRILVRENRLGAHYVDRGGVTTGADGRFQFNAPAGDSRLFRVAYKAYTGDDNFATRSTAQLSVRARISAHGPRHVRRAGEGGGLYRVLVEVDGVIAQGLPATHDDRCVDQTGNRDFAYAVPCPNATGGEARIDSTMLPEGSHVLAIYIEDVAGNRAALMPPSRIRVINDLRTLGYFSGGQFFNPRFAAPRVLNGNGATAGAKLTAAFARQVGRGRSRHRVLRATREIGYAQRATVVGKLTAPSGEPISGATVFVGQQPEGQDRRLDGSVRTNGRGEFRYRPPARQSNRRLRAVYFPFSDSHESAVSRALTLGVRAGMTLQVNRHRLRNGERLVFSGRVLGPVPAAGVAVTLQAKVGRHYRSFRQLRATSATKGRIHTVYRFERTTQPARYRFRLKVVRQAGLPFQSGVSPVVRVSVTP